MLGTLLIAMSMQLDRKGLWNLLGPVLCAILFMVTAWVSRVSITFIYVWQTAMKLFTFLFFELGMCMFFVFVSLTQNHVFILTSLLPHSESAYCTWERRLPVNALIPVRYLPFVVTCGWYASHSSLRWFIKGGSVIFSPTHCLPAVRGVSLLLLL